MGVTDFLLLSCLGFAITAHAQDCAVPVGGPNMDLKGEDILKEIFASGDQAAFECDIGYSSAGGSSSITCTAGSWSTVSLKCERKNCGSPGELPNGQIHYPKENLFGDHIEITCDEGYRLVGYHTITCGADGWLSRLPRCEVATCDEAPQVKDATFTPYKESYVFGDSVRYSCKQGLTLNGSESISCSDDGTFKPDPPTCTKVQCEDLDIPNLDWISGSRPPHGYKAKITYRCRTGFRMVGQPTLTCDINSQWSPGLPRCDRVICNRPPMMANRNFSPVKEVYEYSNAVQYSCQNGFRLSGSKSASCSDDGTFKPAPPTCTKVQCEDLNIPNLDWISGSRPPHGYKATVTYRCRTGFRMVGQPTLTCDINSQWSPGLPRCEMVICNRPPLVANGSFSPVKEVYKYRDIVEYSCQTGFKLSGSKSVSCSDDGTFKPAPPTCTRIFCEEPQVENGYLTEDARPPYRLNAKVTFECSWFRFMDGEPTLTCQADGQWSPAPPECKLSYGKVTGAVMGGIAAAGAAIGAGAGIYHMSQDDADPDNVEQSVWDYSRQKRLVEEDATEAEEEVALLDGASLKEHPPGNGQASGEGRHRQVARKRVNLFGLK